MCVCKMSKRKDSGVIVTTKFGWDCQCGFSGDFCTNAIFY